MGMYFVEQSLRQVVGIHRLGLCMEVDDDPMAQHRQGDGADVFSGDRMATMQGGSCFASEYEKLRCPRSRPPIDHLFHILGGRRIRKKD